MKVILRQGESEALLVHPLEVNWTLTSMCNYSCTYCTASPKKLSKKDFSTWGDLEKAVNHVAELHRPWYDIVLGGGEPTVHPHFLRLVAYLSAKLGDRLNYIHVISNGSRSNLFYSKLASLSERARLNINLSIHAEYASIDHLLALVHHISRGAWLRFSLMLHPLFFNKSKAVHAELLSLRQEYPFDVKVKLLRGAPTFTDIDARYDAQQLEWAKEANREFEKAATSSGFKTDYRRLHDSHLFWETYENGKHALTHEYDPATAMQVGMLSFNDMYCTPATRLLAIEPDGSCKGTRCSVPRKSSMNIFRGNPYLEETFMSSAKCTLRNCGCGANLPIPKFLDRQEADRFVTRMSERQSELLCSARASKG